MRQFSQHSNHYVKRKHNRVQVHTAVSNFFCIPVSRDEKTELKTISKKVAQFSHGSPAGSVSLTGQSKPQLEFEFPGYWKFDAALDFVTGQSNVYRSVDRCRSRHLCVPAPHTHSETLTEYFFSGKTIWDHLQS